MWQGDFTFGLTRRAGWWRSIVYRGMPEAEAIFRSELVIMGMKGRETIFECCTQCMLYSVYAILGVNSWSRHGEIERDDLTLCSAMMVEMWMRKREMGDEDENNVEHKSGYEKSGVRPAWLGWEDLVSVLLHAGWGLVPAVSGMVTWLAHELLLSPSFSWCFVPSPLPSPKNTKLSHPSPSLHAMIKSQHRVQHTPSTAYTEYSIHRVQHTLSTASSQHQLSPARSQSLISWQTMMYSILHIPTITS